MDPVIEVPTTADVPTDVGRDNPLADFLTSLVKMALQHRHGLDKQLWAGPAGLGTVPWFSDTTFRTSIPEV